MKIKVMCGDNISHYLCKCPDILILCIIRHKTLKWSIFVGMNLVASHHTIHDVIKMGNIVKKTSHKMASQTEQ
jgi:hypothetical protein